jgi:hypothetical protein
MDRVLSFCVYILASVEILRTPRNLFITGSMIQGMCVCTLS